MTRQSLARLTGVLLLLALAYGMAMWQPVRNWYAPPWDKLAHAVVFALVYAGLAWALRWRLWPLAGLAAALGAVVELHQVFLPGFNPSLEDWLADLVGIGLAAGAHTGALRRGLLAPTADADLPPGLLDPQTFRSAVQAVPLVSVDWVLTNPAGQLLLGLRLNAPAQGSWFTPGGRVRKGEPLSTAQLRVAMDELGLPAGLARALVQRARAMGAWDHFYPDAAFSPTVPTHYVNLPYAAGLSASEVQALRLPVGEQHGHWQWLPPGEALVLAHPHVQPYARWLMQQQQPHPATETHAH